MAAISIIAHCHCRRFDVGFSLPESHLPLQSAFCSCNSCRYATGQLAASFVTVELPARELDLDVSLLSVFRTSDGRKRHFCPDCGANVVDLADDKWRFCTGTVADTPGLVLERRLIFVEDARDGGMAPWLKDVGRIFAEGTGSQMLHSEQLRGQSTSSTPAAMPTALPGKCHCGTVQFEILPLVNARHHAGLDACKSCRLTTGFEITCWVSVPLDHVRKADGNGLQLNTLPARSYESSPGVFRYFCSRCGAAVLVAKKDQPWVDIAAGLLRAPEGARAENWLQWKELGFLDELDDTVLRNHLRVRFDESSSV